MIGRRGFLGALAGMPIAAVVQPKVSVPEVTAPKPYILIDETHHQVHAKMLTPPNARRGELAVTISCDTSEFQREVARAQRVIDAAGRRLERALYRGIRVERA